MSVRIFMDFGVSIKMPGLVIMKFSKYEMNVALT